MERALDDPVAAERYLREAHEAFREMGERRYSVEVAVGLAEALYAQGRFDEAQQMTDHAQAANPADADWWNRTLNLRAMLLARSRQFSAAMRLVAEAEALTSARSANFRAEVMVAKAEVNRLAGARDEAAASLRAALRIYEDRRATQLASQIRAALATLAIPADCSPA